MPGVDAGSQERGGSLAGGSDCRAPIVTSRMVRTTVQLPEDQAAALTRAARRRGVSKAAIVREALSVLLERESRLRARRFRAPAVALTPAATAREGSRAVTMLAADPEGCPSGLRSATGNRVCAERCIEGSNPSPSASEARRRPAAPRASGARFPEAGFGTMRAPGEVAEWLKAAPC
jgi:hypothetical protein